MTTLMNSILSGLSLETESLDAAFFKSDGTNDHLLLNLNKSASEPTYNFTIEISDVFGDRITLPSAEELSSIQLETISFIKNRTARQNFFFTKSGFITNLSSSEIAASEEIYIYEDFNEFSTLTCIFKKWNLDSPTPQKPSDEKFIDARKIVNDLAREQISANHLFWITNFKNEQNPPSEWLEFSTPKAALLLFSEISKSDTGLTYTLKGSRNIEFNSDSSKKLNATEHKTVHSALAWVFDTPRDVEIRHTLLCQRLSHNSPRNAEPWIKFISRTITSSCSAARDDYKNHLLIKTGELLKAVTDIRKTVSDETNKIVDKTNGLTSSLLRDASITFLITSLRQTLIAKNLISAQGSTLILIATATWLIISISLTGYQNKLFIKSQIRFRRNWSKGLSSLIPEGELNKIAKRPFREAVDNYRKIKNIINSIYATIILTIVSIIIFE